ncbi:MAG TPA: response regulator [Pyrinomonadaceae bacterium]|nr:response regulator [Pyrinomonadaceae bacterium]
MPDVANEKTTILVVDDEPSVGDALRMVLESSGYEVVLVTNGVDGIEQARRRRFAFGVVDLRLTDISGFQVITRILDLQPQTPLVLMTAHGGAQVFAEAKKLGAIGGLSKPFHPSEILKLIELHVNGPTADPV